MSGEQDPGQPGTAAVLGGVGFVTLTALVLAERFAEVPPFLAAYAGALCLLGRDRTGRVQRVAGPADGRPQSR